MKVKATQETKTQGIGILSNFTWSKGIDNALRTPTCSSQTAFRNLMSCLCVKGRIKKQANNGSPNETAENWASNEAYLQQKKEREYQKAQQEIRCVALGHFRAEGGWVFQSPEQDSGRFEANLLMLRTTRKTGDRARESWSRQWDAKRGRAARNRKTCKLSRCKWYQ